VNKQWNTALQLSLADMGYRRAHQRHARVADR
jgi:hypothetical protein